MVCKILAKSWYGTRSIEHIDAHTVTVCIPGSVKDILTATPLLHELQQTKEVIVFVAKQHVEWLSRMPSLTVYGIPTQHILQNRLFRTWWAKHPHHSDVGFALHPSACTSLFLKASRVPVVFGQDTQYADKTLDLRGKHLIDAALTFGQQIGMQVPKQPAPQFILEEAAVHEVDELLKHHNIGSYVAVIPYDLTAGKRPTIPDDVMHETLQRLAQKHKVVLLGHHKHPQFADIHSNIFDFGNLSIDQCAALMAQAGTVITIDNDALQLAGAVAKKIIAIYGPTNPHLTAPRYISTIVLWKQEDQERIDGKKEGEFFAELTAGQIVNAVEKLFAKTVR